MTKIGIISDIHAFHAPPGAARHGEGDPSWVRTAPDKFEESRGPFQALQDLILSEGLAADYLISCGDMGDKADERGIAYAWGWLEAIRRRLDASTLIGITGNHDVDSRDVSGRNDAMYCTRALQPPFPIDDVAIRESYWKSNVATFSDGDIDIVLLNTAAEHANTEMASRGRVTDETLESLAAAVQAANSSKRVLVTHHHPYRHDAVDRTDESALDGGPEVLRILQEDGNWLVVHGHRHYPNLVYASGSIESPVILAAGSFSAILYPELQTRVRNQFHLLELDTPGNVEGTSGSTGLIRSWEYSPSQGWAQPISLEGIPDQSGFGYRGPMEDAKSIVRDFVKAKTERFVVLEELLVLHPKLRYLLPIDRKSLLDDLIAEGTIRVTPERHFATRSTEVFLS